MSDSSKELVVRKIENGTVIDHITPGKGYLVVKILRIGFDAQYYLAQNVPSPRFGRKDVVKITDRYPTETELDIISLIAPMATINRVREWAVAEKFKVQLPSLVAGVIHCPNSFCITNYEKGLHTEFKLVEIDSKRKLLQCSHCDSLIELDEVERYIET